MSSTLLDVRKGIVSINVNREGKVNAAYVSYSNYSGYIWEADADVSQLGLDNYSSVLEHLQHSGSSLEITCLNGEILKTELVYFQREGGYKEPFQRVVQYSFVGCNGLSNLEGVLSTQSQRSEIDGFGKKLLKGQEEK